MSQREYDNLTEVLQGVEPTTGPILDPGATGNCFCCSMKSALDYQLDDAPSYEDTWNYFREPYANSDKIHVAQTWPGMVNTVKRIESDYLIEHKVDILDVSFGQEEADMGLVWFCAMPWQRYTEVLYERLSEGWTAITHINYAGRGPYNNGYITPSDHFVVLDGAKFGWEKEPEESLAIASKNYYIHVVCSAKGAGYWIKSHKFMRNHGGASWLFVRRTLK